MSHINKKHKVDTINGEGNNVDNSNNNNNKIIVLPIIIQKYILELLYKPMEDDSHTVFGYQKRREFSFYTEDTLYALVNWVWFKKCQSLHSKYTLFKFTNQSSHCRFEEHNLTKRPLLEIDKEECKYKFMNKSVIENISIEFLDISSTLVNEINGFSSLKSIEVNSDGGFWIGNSVWLLNHLNKLNDSITVNFSLFVCDPDRYIENEDIIVEKETFKFKVGYFNVEFLNEFEVSYGFLYEIIKDLRFKSFYFRSSCYLDSGATHLEQYHSISKLNQNVKCVVIANDYIPLYALYRFLKAPKLLTLEFSLQFHFLSSIYRKNKENTIDNSMVNFDKLDTFQFNSLSKEYKYDGDMKYYIENGINEDCQVYCSYSRQYNKCTEIPSYSKLLLDECLKLLKNNTTITSLKITSEQCTGECDRNAGDGGDQYSLFDDQFFNDFFGSLSSNKTIKELYLDLFYLIDDWETGLLEPKIAMMLDQNKTLEYLYLGRSLDVAQVSKLTTNKKCKLISK